jgi:Ca2+-binding EF-hand superfamily protein
MNVTTLAITTGNPEKAKNLIKRRISLDEIELMSKLGLENGDGQIDFTEFVLLCCVRLGALNPGLIGEINQRFDKLDISKKGYLTRDEILQDFRRGNLYSRWTKADSFRTSQVIQSAQG